MSPYPRAVRLEWIRGRVREGCTPIGANDRRAGDFPFPPDSVRWYRPSPLFESRVLGRWPTQGSSAVWTDTVWNLCLTRQVPDQYEPLALGCDKARFSNDFTSLLVRRGNCVMHHETHNGWNNNQIAGRLKQLCRRFSLPNEEPRTAPVRIDDVQGAIVDMADGYNFQSSNSRRAVHAGAFPNKRTALWFETVDRAVAGRLDLSRLNEESRLGCERRRGLRQGK